jgi:hypothetical protein
VVDWSVEKVFFENVSSECFSVKHKLTSLKQMAVAIFAITKKRKELRSCGFHHCVGKSILEILTVSMFRLHEFFKEFFRAFSVS